MHFLKIAIPWILVAALALGLIASYFEIQRLRKKSDALSQHSFHDHAVVRRSIIKSAMEQEQAPIVVYGDSLAEMSRLPSEICGRPVVNAGIGGAKISELAQDAGLIASARMTVLVAGTNDFGSASFYDDYIKLIQSVPRPIVTPSTMYPDLNAKIEHAARNEGVLFIDVRFDEFDGVHPTPKAYREWMPRVLEAISSECAR